LSQDRNRAWRRFQRIRWIKKRGFRTFTPCLARPLVRGKLSKTKGLPQYGVHPCFRPNKKWKLIYWRSNKLARADQLKMEYPRQPWWLLLDDVFLTEDE
jgi:hypothetical protein